MLDEEEIGRQDTTRRSQNRFGRFLPNENGGPCAPMPYNRPVASGTRFTLSLDPRHALKIRSTVAYEGRPDRNNQIGGKTGRGRLGIGRARALCAQISGAANNPYFQISVDRGT